MTSETKGQVVKTDKAVSTIRALAEVDRQVKKYHTLSRGLDAGLELMELHADTITALEDLLTPSRMEKYMRGQGKATGFLTDKDRSGGYQMPIVRDVLITAYMDYGLVLTRNWVNIIGSRCYVTQSGYFHILHHWPGLTDLRIEPVKTEPGSQGWVKLTMLASWKLDGVAASVQRTFAVQKHERSGWEAVEGKGKRKILAAVFEILKGGTFTAAEGDVRELQPELPPRAPKVQKLTSEAPAAPERPFTEQAEELFSNHPNAQEG